METYRTCKAYPPYTIGLSRQEVIKSVLGDIKNPPPAEKPIEVIPEILTVEPEPVEEPEIIEVVSEPVEETPEPVIETPVVEEVVETVVEETPVVVNDLAELGISEKIIADLEVNDIRTIAQLQEYVDAGLDIEDMDKIGRAAKKKIEEGLAKWNAQNQTK